MKYDDMKRRFFLIWILSGMLCGINAEAQQITVADGTSESLYYPLSVYHWTQSQHSQSIYPASMLTELQGHYITTLTWYFVTMPTLQWDGVQTVRLGITNDNNLWDGFSSSPTVEVWSGQMSAFFEEGCLRIPLDTAFLYTGGNLLVEVYKPAGGSYGSERFYGQIKSSSQMPPLISSINVVGNNSNVPYEGNILPKLTFTYQDSDCSFPEMLASFGITTSTADLSWVPGVLGMAYQYQVAYRTAADTSYTEVMVSDTFCTLSDLIPNTTYYWKVKSLCGDSASSDWSLERTFTTLRTYATVPYFCDFEDSVENALWNLPNNYPLYYGKWFIGSYVSYSGNHSLYNTYDDGVTNICSSNVSPFNQIWSYREFYLDPLYPQYVISFKHRGYGRTTPYFGPSNNTTLKQLCSGSVLPYDSVWMDHNYTFSVDTPGVYRLSFRWYKSSYDNGNPGISIDDISITGVPCLPPNTLTTTNITDSSATLSWQHNCVDAPMGYIVGYKTAGDYNYTEFTVYDTNSVTLTGLSVYTDYYWRVKTLYNDSVSTDWSSVATFKTELQWVHPLPYYCDFEDAVENLAWNVPVISGNNKNRWYFGHNTYHSANTSLYVTTKANGSDNSYVYTSESALWTYRDVYFDPQYAGYEFSFDAKVRGDENNAYAIVYIGTPIFPSDSMPMDSLVQIGDKIHHTSSGYSPSWKHYEYTLDSTFAGVRRIYFFWQNHNINSGYYPAIAIDDISVTGTGCARPLHLSDIPSDTTAQLTWRACELGTPESYTVAYKSSSDSAYTEIVTSDTTIALTGLQPLTTYSWKVRTNCSGNESSEWSQEITFETYQLLATMPYACGFEDSLQNSEWGNYYWGTNVKWCIGSAVTHNGQNTCYLSNNDGVSHQTNNPAYTDAYLYRDFLFDTTFSEYVLEFDFKTFDTTSQSDIQIFVESPATPDFVEPLGGSQVAQVCFTDTLWHHVTVVINRTHGGLERLFFAWLKNDFNTAKGSCAIDDITLSGRVCGRPYALANSNITHQSAQLTWESGNRYSPVSYQLAYCAEPDTAYTVLTVTDTFLHFTPLTPSTHYRWKVRAIAADGLVSAWSDESTFFTAAVLPYYTDFENDADNRCWRMTSSGVHTWVTGSAVNHGGTHSLYVTNGGGVSNASTSTSSNSSVSAYRDIFIDPMMDKCQISFDYLGVGSDVLLQSLDSLDGSAVVIFHIPSSEQWQHHYILLDSTFVGLQRLYFRRSFGIVTNQAGAVDNLVVKQESCPPPTALAISFPAPQSALLSWNAVGGQHYEVAYKPQSDNNYTVVSAQDTFLLVSNLQPSTPYFWKVRMQCSDSSDIAWSSENVFTLLPYFCDFEDTVENTRWTYDASSEWNYWAINALTGDNGNVSLHISSGYGNGNYNYYSTARLWAYRDIYFGGSGSRYQVSFDFKGYGQKDVDFARVYLGPVATPSGLNPPEGSVQLGGNLCMVPRWTHYSLEVDNTFTGWQRLYFQWRCDGSSGINPAAAIDNITVQVSDCAIPVNPEAASVTATSATLLWNPGDGDLQPMNYTVAYRLLDDTVFTEVTTTDTVLTLNGLQPDSYYYWQVRANCSVADASLWSMSRTFATAQPMPATLPYASGFENGSENAAWTHRHLRGPNEWVVGSATYLDGDSALYVSSDGGVTNSYSNSSISTEWVYRDFYFPPGNDEYEVSFDFKGKGSNYHYARVYMGVPSVLSADVAPEKAELLGGSLYNVADWQHYFFQLDSTHSGVQRLYILWQNNTYSATQPPVAFDNIVISANPCREPIDLVSEATAHSVSLSWTMRYGGGGAGYTVAYRPQNDTTYTYVNVSDTSLMLQNLNSDVFYVWKVRHNCDGSCSVWSEERTFYTHDQILYVCDFDTPESVAAWGMQGGDASFHWYAGRHDGSLPNGTLYVSADYGQTNIYNTGLAADLWAFTDVYITPGHSACQLNFDFKGMGENNYDYMNVYVGAPTMPSGAATPSGAAALAQKIALKADWTHYTFSIDSTHSGLQRIYFLWHNDNSGGSNPPAAIDNICLSHEAMPLLGVIHVSPYDTSAHLQWGPGDTLQPISYTLAYAALASDSLMTEITLQDTVFDLADLVPNTDYLCKVRANYADGGHSLWLMSQFRTLEYYARVPYYCDFENDTENEKWQLMRYGNVNQWVIDTAAANGGERSLYISDDGGATNEYAINSNTKAWAFRDIYLDPAQSPYLLYFDFRGVGELWYTQPYDYAKVFIGPAVTPDVSSYSAALPAGLTQLDTTLLLQTTWGTHTIILDSILTGYKRLYFLWSSDNVYGENPAAAFDNIYIVPFGCSPPAAIVIDSVSKTEMSFHITDYFTEHHNWDVALVAENDTLDESQAIILHDTLSYTFTQLYSGSVYTIYVRTRCSDNDFSDWISTVFVTPADTTQPVNPDDTVGVVHYLSERMIVLYPNPADQYVEVRADDDVTILYVEVYDLLGNRILQTAPQENPARVRVSELASGLYLLRVTTEQGVVTKRFVRR